MCFWARLHCRALAIPLRPDLGGGALLFHLANLHLVGATSRRKRTPAALLMTLLVAAVVVAPFAILVATLADSVATVAQAVNSLLEQGPPAPPGWVAEIPLIGERLALYWQGLAYNAPAFLVELTKLDTPCDRHRGGQRCGSWRRTPRTGPKRVHRVFFYRYGRQMAASVRGSSERIGGTRARHLLAVVGSTVTGVVYGVIGTAIAQGLLAGLGFWIAGVPQALLLGFLTFLLSFVPAAPPLVWGVCRVLVVLSGRGRLGHLRCWLGFAAGQQHG